MLNKTTDLEKPNLRFDGFYRGVVVDVADPLEAGRIKIKLYPMFKDIETINIPWAIYASGMGGYANVGNIDIPIVNSHVFCFFENGDWRHPVYFAGAPAIENDIPDVPTSSRSSSDVTVTTINTNTKKNISDAAGSTWDEPDSAHAATYPKNSVYRSESGIMIEIDDTTDNVRFHIFHPSGSREEIDNTGNRAEHTEGNKYTIVIGNDNIYITGAHNITTDGDCNIYAKGNMKLKTDGNLDETVTGDHTITVTGDYKVTANRIDLN